MHEDGTTPERWLPVVGWEGLYEVSDHGRVRSLPRVVAVRSATGRRLRSRVLKPGTNGNGYLQVVLCRDGRPQTCKVHRLLLEAFAGPCPDGHQTRHLDGVRTNNHLPNLAWGSATQNSADRVRHGTWVAGEIVRRSQLSATEVREIRASSETARALACRFGVCVRTVSRVRSGQSWAHIH